MTTKAPFQKVSELLILHDMNKGDFDGWLKILTQHGWTQEEYFRSSLEEINAFLQELFDDEPSK